MLQTHHSLVAPALLCALVPSVLFVAAHGQTASAADAKLPLRAALVLTPEFCSTRIKQKAERFEVGQAACVELEPALEGTFSSLTRVAEAPSSGDLQVVLLPRFVNAGATTKVGFSKKIMVVLLEWTVKDLSGKTVWFETVQGSAKGGQGNLFTYKGDLRRLVEDSVKDAAQQSASKMSSAPELRKLAQ
jgi:hypothetical protein